MAPSMMRDARNREEKPKVRREDPKIVEVKG